MTGNTKKLGLDFVVYVAALLVSVIALAAWAQRSDTFAPGAVVVRQVDLTQNADGTYGLSVCAFVKSDKGAQIESCEQAVVRNAGRKSNIDALFTQARDIWLERAGLGVDAGQL